MGPHVRVWSQAEVHLNMCLGCLEYGGVMLEGTVKEAEKCKENVKRSAKSQPYSNSAFENGCCDQSAKCLNLGSVLLPGDDKSHLGTGTRHDT